MRDYAADAKVFKALCDENRLRILEILRGGEKCACVLLSDLQISQSTLSYHMKILCDSGVVTGRKEGKWTHYSINPSGAALALCSLQMLTDANMDTMQALSCCDAEEGMSAC